MTTHSWNPNPDEILTSTLIVTSAISFIIYWFVAQSEKIKSRYFNKYSFDVACRKHIFFTKYFGFFTLGIFPLIVYLVGFENTSPKDVGLHFNAATAPYSFLWIMVLSLVAAPLAFISAKKEENLRNYPQIRSKHWTDRTFIINLLGWALYLFGYELLFRGTLLFPLVKTIGIWPAIAINIALYAATHIPKGLAETIGAIPLGFVLCILTIESETIWIAFIVHVVLAWTNSLTALAYHPEITYQRWIKNR
jgi:membrane protease YdiL (CAAX protease family)